MTVTTISCDICGKEVESYGGLENIILDTKGGQRLRYEVCCACYVRICDIVRDMADRKTEPTSCKTCRYGELDEGYVRCAYYSKSSEQSEPKTDRSE